MEPSHDEGAIESASAVQTPRSLLLQKGSGEGEGEASGEGDGEGDDSGEASHWQAAGYEA